MKKTLSVLLALTMLFALCVPAFAANPITEANSAPDSSAIIKTNTDAFVDTDGYYSVTFPAETSIPWSKVDSKTPLNCTVYSNLMNNKKLNITVAAADAASVMKDANNNKIAFTLGGAAYNAAASFVNNEAWAPTVDITAAAWNGAPIGAYSANLTFTVAVA